MYAAWYLAVYTSYLPMYSRRLFTQVFQLFIHEGQVAGLEHTVYLPLFADHLLMHSSYLSMYPSWLPIHIGNLLHYFYKDCQRIPLSVIRNRFFQLEYSNIEKRTFPTNRVGFSDKKSNFSEDSRTLPTNVKPDFSDKSQTFLTHIQDIFNTEAQWLFQI